MRPVYLLLAGMLVGLLSACSGHSSKTVIEGRADGISGPEPVVANLLHFEGNVAKILAVDTLREGRFRFELDSLADSGNHYGIMLETRPAIREKKRAFASAMLCSPPDLFLEPGVRVRIKGLARHFETAQITSPVKDQRLRQRFLKRMSWTDWDQYQDLYAERNAIVSRLTIDTTLTDRERDSLRARANLLRAQRDSLGIIRVSRQIQVMAKEPVGQYWMHEMTVLAKALSYRYYLEFRPEIERLFDRLPPEVKDSPEGREIEDYLSPVKIVRIGDTLPDYDYIDRTGRACHLSEFLGKTVLLDFWSLSCGPCIKSMPILQELQEKTGDRLEIVSISLDKDRVWKRGHEEHPVSWTDWRDPSGYSGSIRSFKARGIPTFVLVSPQGVVQEIQEGFTEGSLRRLVGLEN